MHFSQTLFLVFVLFVAAVCAQSYLDRNTTFIDNGDVCDTFEDPSFLPPTTCAVSPISGDLAAALASCAGDDFIIITLGPGFSNSGPLVFPDAQTITLWSPTADALIQGAPHIVNGSFTKLVFSGVTFDGEGTDQLLFDPPLRSNDLSLLNRTIITRFYGSKAILMEAGDDDTNITMINSYCIDIWSSCIAASGLMSRNFQNNEFQRCGGTPDSCLFLKNHWASLGVNVFFRNVCYLLWNELPPRCINNIDPAGFVRCNGEEVQCLDISATTLAGDCPLIDFTYYDNSTMSDVTIQVFEEFCRRYRPCECEEVTFRDASNFTIEDIIIRVGDIIYPTITLECQPGTELVGSGVATATDAIQFEDPSFEQSWPNSPPFWTINSPVQLIFNETNVIKEVQDQGYFNYEPKLVIGIDAYQGTNFVFCRGGYDQSFSQQITLTSNSTYSVGFFARRRDGARGELEDLRMELYLNTTEVAAIEGVDIAAALIQDNPYYELRFPLFVAEPGVYDITFRCNFVDGQNDGVIYIDNVFSNQGGLTLVNFPPGLGLGPPVGEDPLNYVAVPLTSDASIILPPCPACEPAPTRPPDIPCNYPLAQNFTCYPTIADGKMVCLTPMLPAFGGGLMLLDESFENAANTTLYPQVWMQSGTPSITNDALTPFPARTGSFALYCQDGQDCLVSQTRNNTDAGLYTLQFWARTDAASILGLTGKYVEFQLDGVSQQIVSGLSLQSILLDDTQYYLVQFPAVFINIGVHLITLRINLIGGGSSADLMVDDVQFSAAAASPSATPTPSITPSPSMIPFNITGNMTIGNITAGNVTNATEPDYPGDLLRCVENFVYLGNDVFTGGCILPLDFIIEENNQSFTAQDCIIFGSCTLPEMYSFEINGFTVFCASATFGAMSCDCSADVLVNTTLGRTIASDSACYEFDKMPRTTANWFIRENDAMQLPWGAITRRMEYDTIIASSVALADYFDERAVGRELAKQDNRFYGPVSDGAGGVEQATRILMDALPEYEEVCERNCPIFNPLDPGEATVCEVNQAANDLDTSYFQTVQDALDTSRCRQANSIIVVQSTIQFYEEDLIFGGDNVRLFSTTNATIIGNHLVTGNVNLLFSRGLNWIHQGKSGDALFDIDDAGDLKNLTLYNNYFGGGGVKNAGILNNRKRRIDDVDIRYNRFEEFSTTVVRITAARIIFSHNTIEACSGRLLQNRYTEWFKVQHNVFINSRGANNIKKPSMLELRYIGARGSEPCQAEGVCLYRHNVQIEDDPEGGEDFKETCVELIKGAVWVTDVRDNVCIKARTGLRVRRMLLFARPEDSVDTTEGFLELFQRENPKIRNTRTRIRKGGEDFKVDGFVSGARLGGRSCVYPECAPEDQRPKFCIANLNFDPLQSRSHGFQTFTNITEASFFCPLNLVQITVFGGTKIIPEAWDVTRPLSDELRFPLKDTTTIRQIVRGERPGPSRFNISGVDVRLDQIDYFTDLLDRNRTYGFGEVTLTQVGSVNYCVCPGFLEGSPLTTFFWVLECSPLLTDPVIDVCSMIMLPALPNVTLLDCTQAPLVCTPFNAPGFYGAYTYDAYNCEITATYTYSYLNASNDTVIVVDTFSVTDDYTFPLTQCNLFADPIYQANVSQSALNIQRRPSYYSVGSRYRALNISFEHLDFYLHYGNDFDDIELGQDMLTNVGGTLERIARDIVWDGLGVEPPGPVNAYRFFHGIDYGDDLGRKKENRRPGIFGDSIVENCIFRNFLYYESILNNTAGSQLDEDEVFQFPYSNGYLYEALNYELQDGLNSYVINNTFSDIDRRFLDVRFSNRTFIINNTAYRVGGRSFDSTAAWYIEPNSNSPNYELVIEGNNFTQKRPVVYPFIASQFQPALTAGGWIAVGGDKIFDECFAANLTIEECLGADLGCCPVIRICGNFMCGHPIAIRFVGRRETVTQWIYNGLPDGQTIKFDDDKSPLREISFCNNASIDGTICDMVIGEPFLDFRRNYICCQETCAPNNPRACRINSTDPRINPTHPWWRVFWFDDINQALEECQARNRQILLEQPSDGAPYDIRINATVTEPVILQYRERYVFPVTITVLSTSPIDTNSPQASIPIDFTDASTVPQMEFELIPGVLTLNTSDIEIGVSMQLPYNTSVGVPTLSPNGFTTDIDVVFTFIAPNVSTALPDCIFFNLSYTSPVQFVSAFQADYSAFLIVEFNFTNGVACLIERTGMVVKGVGDPVVRCDGHSVYGQYITFREFRLLHADPCVDPMIGDDCPCLPQLQPGSNVTASGWAHPTAVEPLVLHPLRQRMQEVYELMAYGNVSHEEALLVAAEMDDSGAGELPFQYGRATWHQNDTDVAPGLTFYRMVFDGDDYERIALDGFFHQLMRLKSCTFEHYSLSNPGFVVRTTGSRLDGCCGGANCSTMKFVFDDNLFIGDGNDQMTGSLILARNMTTYDLTGNYGEDACCIDSIHPYPGAFYMRTCPGSQQPITIESNLVARVDDGDPYQGRVTRPDISGCIGANCSLSDCYWSVYHIAGFPDKRRSIRYNAQYFPQNKTQSFKGAAICMRLVDYPIPIPNVRCRQPLYDVLITQYNSFCDGAQFDITRTMCEQDLCIRARAGCIGSDPPCEDAVDAGQCMISDQGRDYKCYWCNDGCLDDQYLFWLIFIIPFLVLLAMIAILCLARAYCFSSRTFNYVPQIGESGAFLPADPEHYPVLDDAMRGMRRPGRWLGSIGTTEDRFDEVATAGASTEKESNKKKSRSKKRAKPLLKAAPRTSEDLLRELSK